MLVVLNRLNASAITSKLLFSLNGIVRPMRKSTERKLSPVNVLRGSMPTRSLLPKMSPLASNPANFVKRMGDWIVAIKLNRKSRANGFQLFGVVTVPFTTIPLRTSSDEDARAARKFWLSCGISTKLGFGPLSMDLDQV